MPSESGRRFDMEDLLWVWTFLAVIALSMVYCFISCCDWEQIAIKICTVAGSAIAGMGLGYRRGHKAGNDWRDNGGKQDNGHIVAP